MPVSSDQFWPYQSVHPWTANGSGMLSDQARLWLNALQKKVAAGGGNGGGGGDFTSVAPIRSVAASTTITTSDYTVVATTPSITLTLPAAPATGQIFNAKNGNSTTGQTITVSSGSSVLIDQASTMTLGATASLMVQWDGTQWRIL